MLYGNFIYILNLYLQTPTENIPQLGPIFSIGLIIILFPSSNNAICNASDSLSRKTFFGRFHFYFVVKKKKNKNKVNIHICIIVRRNKTKIKTSLD